MSGKHQLGRRTIGGLVIELPPREELHVGSIPRFILIDKEGNWGRYRSTPAF